MDQLAQKDLAKLGNHSPDLGTVREGLDVLEDLQKQSLADIGNPLLLVPFPNALQVTKSGFGKGDQNLSHLFRTG